MSDTTNEIAVALQQATPSVSSPTLEQQIASLKLAITLLSAGHLQAVQGLSDRITALENRPAAQSEAAAYEYTLHDDGKEITGITQTRVVPPVAAPVNPTKTVPCANPLQPLQR